MAGSRRVTVSVIGLAGLLIFALCILFLETLRADEPPAAPPVIQADDNEPPALPRAIQVVDESKAKTFSDSVVDDLLNDDRDGLFSKVESSVREYYKTKGFDTLIENLFDTFGEPVRVEYKKNMVGQKTNVRGTLRPMRKFWYAVETTKFKIGTHFIFVEVVEEEQQLASSGFAIVNFPLGVPDDMK